MKAAIYLILIHISIASFCQSYVCDDKRPSGICGPEIFVIPGEKVKYNGGGVDEVYKALQKKLVFGSDVTGTITIKTVITCRSIALEPCYSESIYSSITDEEVIKKVLKKFKKLKKWKAGRVKGKAVDTYFTIRFGFKDGRMVIPTRNK